MRMKQWLARAARVATKLVAIAPVPCASVGSFSSARCIASGGCLRTARRAIAALSCSNDPASLTQKASAVVWLSIEPLLLLRVWPPAIGSGALVSSGISSEKRVELLLLALLVAIDSCRTEARCGTSSSRAHPSARSPDGVYEEEKEEGEAKGPPELSEARATGTNVERDLPAGSRCAGEAHGSLAKQEATGGGRPATSNDAGEEAKHKESISCSTRRGMALPIA